ncbi:hypothetical protein [Paraburkholderia tropica]|uniref:hypothetical protein n=1 Tax=Paraburkholderia tropica TaxID=92647 RepID=UPI002AB2F8A8|nr:hypothetical protein [Paraburkholderia tropica]
MTSRWAKRLLDVRQLLINADATYFDAEIFRLNINNAIQTARTVTFLMQKEKNSRPGMEQWYVDHVRAPLEADTRMKWLVDSRNIIEKEGDLDVNSYWRAFHLFSYWDAGPEIRASSRDDLFADLSGLWRLIKKSMPEGVVSGSSIVIDRKWVANSLPEFELVDAVAYGYETLRRVVLAMDEYVGMESPKELHDTKPLFSIAQLRRSFIKFSDGATYRLGDTPNTQEPSAEVKRSFAELLRNSSRPIFGGMGQALEEGIRQLSDFAVRLFNKDKYHISLCMLFSEGRLTQLLEFHPADQAEKFIFWHEMAYCVKLWNITEIRFISEAWLRAPQSHEIPISEWPITGEVLHVVGARSDGDTFNIGYEIKRDGDDVRVGEIIEEEVGIPNYLVPSMKTWGHSWEWIESRLI